MLKIVFFVAQCGARVSAGERPRLSWREPCFLEELMKDDVLCFLYPHPHPHFLV